MVSLPQKDFRDRALTFDEFYDLVIIGMVGLTDYLMRDSPPAHVDTMVNYKRVAENLDLTFEPEWIDRAGHELENRLEAIASHDSAPDGEIDDDNWVYLNSGITRIASLLYDKYYIPRPHFELSYEEFRDAFLFEFAGMVQDGITEDGWVGSADRSLSYDLFVTANHLELPYETGWIEQATAEWLKSGLIATEPSPDSGQITRYRLTREGYEHAQTLVETVGAADGFLLSKGRGK